MYAHAFTARRDALFEVLEALLSAGSLSSFARLSQNHRFQRQWPSLSAAVVWFAWLPPVSAPASLPVTAHTLWSAYVQRWTVEPRAYPQNVRSQPRSAAEWRPNGTPLRSVPDYKRLSQRELGQDAPPLAASGARGHLELAGGVGALDALFGFRISDFGSNA